MYKSATMMLATVALLALMVCPWPTVNGAEFINCGDDKTVGNYSLIEVSNCRPEDANCILKRNTNATISITFESSKALTVLKAVVHGMVLGMEVPFKIPNDDCCVDSGLECPLTADTSYKYTATLPVLKQYPKVGVEVKWELKSDDEVVVCVKIPAKIQ